MAMFGAINTASSGLHVSRTWLDAVSDNIANMNDVRATSEAAFQERFIEAQSAPQRDVRRRLRVRDQLVHVRRQAINLMRAQLRSEGVRVPTGAAETFVTRFQASAVSAAVREASGRKPASWAGRRF